MISQTSIRSKREFELVRKKGRSFLGRFFSLCVLSQKEKDGTTRFGIIISLRVSKKAVLRNKKKRQIKEIVGKNREKIKKGYLCVLVAKKSILESSYQELERDLVFLCKKAGIIS